MVDVISFSTVVALFGAAAVVLFGVLVKVFRAGRDRERVDQMKETANVQAKFDRIENERPSLDGAIGRLRERSRRPNDKPPAS